MLSEILEQNYLEPRVPDKMLNQYEAKINVLFYFQWFINFTTQALLLGGKNTKYRRGIFLKYNILQKCGGKNTSTYI